LPPAHFTIYQQLNGCGMRKAAAAFLQEALSSLKTTPDSPLLSGLTTMAENQELIAALTASSSQMSQMAAEDAQTDLTCGTQIKEEFEDPLNKEKKKNLYYCKHGGCDRGFTTLANMKRHEKLHSGEKPYICTHEACNKSFARKYDLKVHSRTHTKEKPYQCALLGCGKRFSRVSSMREHERNIHGCTSTMDTTSSHDIKEELEDCSSFTQRVAEPPKINNFIANLDGVRLPVDTVAVESSNSNYSPLFESLTFSPQSVPLLVDNTTDVDMPSTTTPPSLFVQDLERSAQTENQWEDGLLDNLIYNETQLF